MDTGIRPIITVLSGVLLPKGRYHRFWLGSALKKFIGIVIENSSYTNEIELIIEASCIAQKLNMKREGISGKMNIEKNTEGKIIK